LVRKGPGYGSPAKRFGEKKAASGTIQAGREGKASTDSGKHHRIIRKKGGDHLKKSYGRPDRAGDEKRR